MIGTEVTIYIYITTKPTKTIIFHNTIYNKTKTNKINTQTTKSMENKEMSRTTQTIQYKLKHTKYTKYTKNHKLYYYCMQWISNDLIE